MNKKFVLATVLLAGTIIGAGIFSLPYIFSRLGIIYGFFYLLIFAGVYFCIHLMYAEVIQTKAGQHQFFYFAQTYLKRPFSDLASWIILGELVLVLTVYLVLASVFLNSIWPGLNGWALLIFWFLGSLFIFAKLNWLGWAEFLGALGISAIALIVFFYSLTKPLAIPLTQSLNWSLFFLPLGPILFSLAGRPAIPKVVEEYKQSQSTAKRFSLKKAIFWGTFLPVIVYLIFVFGFLRFNPQIAPEAVQGLVFLNPMFLLLIVLAGLLALWTSYFIIAINVKEILRMDLKLNQALSFGLAIFLPLALYLLGFKNFLSIVSFTGNVFLSLEGIFVITMWRDAFPNSHWRWLSWPLYLVFSLALFYEIIHVLL